MLKFKLLLTSAAEPGTGLGGELVNDRFPRDPDGNPILPGSHLKGLLRRQWQQLTPHLALADGAALEAAMFGMRFTSQADAGADASALHIADLQWRQGPNRQGELVARTAVTELDDARTLQNLPEAGAAKAGSLRVVEAIPAGTIFEGSILWSGSDRRIGPALRLALLALEAVGGSRHRGCGRCVVSFPDSDSIQPADLIAHIRAGTDPYAQPSSARSSTAVVANPTPPPAADGLPTWWQLGFDAQAPVLCPEHPEAANHIQGAAVIPASAVIGAIVSRISATHGSAVAERLLASPAFRAGPLLPSGYAALGSQGLAQTVPLSLKVAKRNQRSACDVLLDPDGDQLESPKTLAGSLIRCADGQLRSLAFADLPRLVRAQVGLDESTRGNGNRGPQLFSVEAIGPCCWSGLLCLPRGWEEVIKASISNVSFGRRRSVFGHGTCSLIELSPRSLPASAIPAGAKLALVAQSPLLVTKYKNLAGSTGIPDPVATMRALITDWIAIHALPAKKGEAPCIASLSVRFGWNRHGRSRRGLQEPDLVLVPGSVVVLEFEAPVESDRLRAALAAGIGEGRERGYGTVLCHPGTDIAGPLAAPEPKPVLLDGSPSITAWALQLATQKDALPSPSQIAQVISHIASGDPKRVERFFTAQAERPRFQEDLAALRKALECDPAKGLLSRIGSVVERQMLIDAVRIVQDIAITLRPKADA